MSAAAMEAGRALDVLIAEKVMGWTRHTDAMGAEFLRDPRAMGRYAYLNDPNWRLPEYSDDIAAAWTVIEAMRERGLMIDIETMGERYNATASHAGSGDEDIWIIGDAFFAESAPLAICRAALDAVEAAP